MPWGTGPTEVIVIPPDGEVPGGNPIVIGGDIPGVGAAGLIFYWNWPTWGYRLNAIRHAGDVGLFTLAALNAITGVGHDMLAVDYDESSGVGNVYIGEEFNASFSVHVFNPTLFDELVTLAKGATVTTGPLTVNSGATLALAAGSLFTIDGVSQPRGLKSRVDSAANSGAIGAEAIVLTAPSMTFKNGRCYEVKHRGGITASVANVSTIRFRKTNLAGQLLYAVVWPAVAGALTFLAGDQFYVKNVSGADITAASVLTLQASAGTSTHLGSGTLVRELEIRDCGAAADYTNAAAIV